MLASGVPWLDDPFHHTDENTLPASDSYENAAALLRAPEAQRVVLGNAPEVRVRRQ